MRAISYSPSATLVLHGYHFHAGCHLQGYQLIPLFALEQLQVARDSPLDGAGPACLARDMPVEKSASRFGESLTELPRRERRRTGRPQELSGGVQGSRTSGDPVSATRWKSWGFSVKMHWAPPCLAAAAIRAS